MFKSFFPTDDLSESWIEKRAASSSQGDFHLLDTENGHFLTTVNVPGSQLKPFLTVWEMLIDFFRWPFTTSSWLYTEHSHGAELGATENKSSE